MKPHSSHRTLVLPAALFAAVVFAGVHPGLAQPPKPSETNAKRMDAVQKRIAADYRRTGRALQASAQPSRTVAATKSKPPPAWPGN